VTSSLLGQTTSVDKTAAELVEEAESFVRAALDSLSAHTAVLDETGTILYVNKAWRDFADRNNLGDPNYNVGVNYLTVCDQSSGSEDAALVADGIRDVLLRQTDEFYLEYPCHSQTERRWYIVRVSRFTWYGTVRLIVSHQNITEMRQARNELQESKQRLEAILDNLVDGILTFDERGVIDSINPAGAYIFGYQRDELIGRSVTVLVPELDNDADEETVLDFVGRLGSLGDELEGERKDGSRFPIYFAVSEIFFDDKRLFCAIVQDFTERKFLEAQFRDKERLNMALEKERELRALKNRFMSMISHDLRTPLAAIRLANSMLKTYGDRASEEEKRESYETIETQVEYLAELINDIITISRADFNGVELDRERVELETYLRDIIEEVQLAYRKQAIHFNGPNQRLEVLIDKKLMRRAITNLLTNAIKYSPDGTPVEVTLRCENEQAVIDIADSGIGIPEDDVKRLFEPFHRASNVGKIQGTGLGLAITKQFVEQHGGAVSVASQVGQGTTFTVRLPLAQQD
jgi:PAS domain S-box-containing protein